MQDFRPVYVRFGSLADVDDTPGLSPLSLQQRTSAKTWAKSCGRRPRGPPQSVLCWLAEHDRVRHALLVRGAVSGRTGHWRKTKNPAAPAVRREAAEVRMPDR